MKIFMIAWTLYESCGSLKAFYIYELSLGVITTVFYNKCKILQNILRESGKNNFY